MAKTSMLYKQWLNSKGCLIKSYPALCFNDVHKHNLKLLGIDTARNWLEIFAMPGATLLVKTSRSRKKKSNQLPCSQWLEERRQCRRQIWLTQGFDVYSNLVYNTCTRDYHARNWIAETCYTLVLIGLNLNIFDANIILGDRHQKRIYNWSEWKFWHICLMILMQFYNKIICNTFL